MRRSVLVVLVALAVLLGSAAVATAAPKPAYKVTLTTKSVSEAGRFIVVSGKVTGPKAAGKTVTIQRRYVDGPWITVTAATIKKNGRYSARVETPRGGTTSFRALKGKSSARKAGVSAVRSLKVYEWLYLANQGASVEGNVLMPAWGTIGPTTYKRSMYASGTEAIISWKLGNLCTTFTARAEYSIGGGDAADMAVVLNRAPKGGGPAVQTEHDVSTAGPVSINTSVASAYTLIVDFAAMEGSHTLTLGDPRVYCNADHLPSYDNND
jgi:hypothetical protein